MKIGAHLQKIGLDKLFVFFLLTSCAISHLGFSNENAHQHYRSNFATQNIELLLSRLDLDGESLNSEQIASSDPELAAKQLLSYYKKRRSVKHPIDRAGKDSYYSNCATEQDFIYADNALKHIFVGQPAYPPHFCGDDIDWSTNPVKDREWIWQLNRMYFWTSMGKAYWHTRNEKYAKEWCEQLLDWTVKNPNDEAHGYAWRSIEAGIRGYSWTGHFQRFIDSPHLDEVVLAAFLNSCYDHAEYLMTKYRTRSNWGLMEAEGMAFIAMTFPEFKRSEQWKEEAIRRLNNEIDLQVYADGHQRELAIGYHMGCIQWFFRTYELAKLNDINDAFPSSYLEKIERMCEVPMKLCLPDGTNVQFGDAWQGKPGQHNEKFLQWAEFFERDDFLYLATEGREGTAPAKTAYALKESGLYSMRSGWNKEAICLVLKCGPNGGGHCQPENGTFDLYAGGRNLMPDAGSYIYSGDPENRAWFRQTKVHQTLTLNGENAAYGPKLLLWEPGEKLDKLVLENQSYDDLKHRRSVFFIDRRYFILVDEAIGDGSGDIGLHVQLAPGEAIFDDKKMIVTSGFEEGWNVMIETKKQKGLMLVEEEGQVSFEYTKKMPRPAFGYHLEKNAGQKSVRFVTLVAPYQDKKPEVSFKVKGKPEPGSLNIEIEILEDGHRNLIGYNLDH
jgi:heparan-sulfate lyase